MPTIIVIPGAPVETKNMLKARTGTLPEVPELGESDGTPRRYTLLVGEASGTETVIELEATGEQKIVNYGYNGSALTKLLLETGGQLISVGYGKDEGNVLDAFRTDPNRVPLSRPHEEYVSVASAEIPVAQGDLWDPGLADTIRYLVQFMVINNDAGKAAVTGVYVGREIDSVGGLAAPNYWMYNETIPHPGHSTWSDPFLIHGDDAIRGVAAVANDASIHFKVRRIDLGA